MTVVFYIAVLFIILAVLGAFGETKMGDRIITKLLKIIDEK